jgi:tetratricopeptide (TPR) repeat protein
MRELSVGGRSRCVSLFTRACLLVLLPLSPFRLPGHEPAGSYQAEVTSQAALKSATNLPLQLSATKTGSPDTVGKLVLPQSAKDFRFTKVDLELLRQVDAFDKYISKRGWVYDNPQTNEYLQKLGLSLVPKETPENVKWHFCALRDIEVNAFALPNGSIYVNSGLLSRMENEAQLAGVLAHEVTHVLNRHGYLEYRSSRKKMVAIDIMLAAGSVAYYSGGNPLITTALANLVPNIVVGTIFGYSRNLEHEADVYAVNALYLHGYDLREFSRGFELLQEGPEVDLSEERVFWASHPKLASRLTYVTSMAATLQPNPAGFLVNRPAYLSATTNVIRNNAALAIVMGRPRTAVAIAQRLIAEEPHNAENFVLLGDAYRSLGARTPVPEEEEQTHQAKDEARKRLRKMTVAEYDKALLADPRGIERWQANIVRSEEALRKALELDPQNATAHRGLGFVFERKDAPAEALEQFRMYLALVPDAKDARQIGLHIESLENSSSPNKPPAENPLAETSHKSGREEQ